MSASALRGNLLVALGYVALAGLVMAFFELPAPWWPSTGLAVFAILAGGVRWMPGVALGSWLANDLLMGWGTAGALWVTLGNVLGPVLGMALFRRVVRDVTHPFDTALGVAAFFLLLGGLNALVSAAFGATGVAFIEGQGAAVLVSTFVRWMIGDISSAVLLAPVFYLWWRDPWPRVPVHGWFEAIASASLLFGLTAWAFFLPMEGPVASGLVPLILLPLIWIALRASLRDAYTLLVVAFLIMLAGTLLGRGPFAALGAEQAMTALQLRIVVLGAIVLLASALDAERRRAMHALAELNAHLEERVAERTASIEASRERLRQILEALPSPMVMSRAEDGLLIEINDAAAQTLGFSRGELLGLRTVDFYVDPGERDALLTTLRDQGITRQHELRVRHRDGSILWLSVSAALMPDGEEALILLTFQDITPSKQREHELERLASIDGLTGALNRRQFMLEVGQRLREGALHVSPLAMLILDLDHFKRVNDTYGHLASASVRRLLPTARQGPIDPFVFFDHFHAGAGAGFPDHPHRGFEAITLLLSGELRHTDNLGNDATLRAGEVQAFTAGRGMVHAEMVGAEQAAEGLQLWINLPRALKGIEPDYQRPARPRRVVAAGFELLLITQPEGPIRLHTPAWIALLELAPGETFTPGAPEHWRGFAYVLRGRLRSHAGEAGAGEGLRLEGGIPLFSEEGAHALIALGQPHEEPILLRGPYVD